VSKRKRVLWKEGMFLQPQHFQVADTFFEKTVSARWAFQNPFFSGVADSAVDTTALTNGVFSLTSCSGIMPDGTAFSIPQEDDPPLSRSFTDHFSHEQQSCDVFLALPLTLEGRPSAGQQPDGAAGQYRYRIQSGTIVDEVTGTQKKQIETAAYNFTILYSGESLDNFTFLRIACLKRSPNGQIELQDDYVPPLVQIGGSQFLMGQLRSLLELLLAKSSALSQGRKEGAGGKATFTSGEETAFRLLGVVNTYTPLLNHYHYEPRLHPFELFRLFTQLAGALTVFSTDVSLKDLTRYDHDNLGGTFGGLIKLIRSVLEADMDAGCMVIPLEQVNPATYVCRLPNDKLMAVARFYLGVSAKAPEKELIVGVAQRIKVSSRDRLDVLISSAMPGLPLIHVAHPPEGLSTKPGFLYFALDQQSQFWRGMQSTGSIAMYFPNNYSDLKLEMLALRQ
jgi:type VI secretion system protein ImpJ